MNDILGTLCASTGQTIKVVMGCPGSMPDQRVAAFPTLTETVIVAIDGASLTEALMSVWSGEGDHPTDEEVDYAMMTFIPEIVEAAQRVLASIPNNDPFDLAEGV
jgi:hypothetical protein